LSETWVSFKVLTQAQCEYYWATGEPQGKAGAYAIQGRAASFVTKIEGSYSGVVGLPLLETLELLESYGVSCWDSP
ncbi:MAG: Maf family protein, partial [Porticoccaceae bacterium]|nr:Maf family protein [Porticoccaceae bacterium]